MNTGEWSWLRQTKSKSTKIYLFSKEAFAYTSHLLNKQKIGTVNHPNMAFCIAFDSAVAHTGPGQYFFGFLFFYEQLNFRFCWHRLMQPIESLYIGSTTSLLTRTMMGLCNILMRLQAQAKAVMDNIVQKKIMKSYLFLSPGC